MKPVWMMLVLVVGYLCSCQKRSMDDVRNSGVLGGFNSMPKWTPHKPIPIPDSVRIIPIPRLGKIEKPTQFAKVMRCVYSYADLVDALGTNKLLASAVVLDGGSLGDIKLERSLNLPGMWYIAVPESKNTSLFQSQLMVEWRPNSSVNFSGFQADVWSLGCTYENTVKGPFTNLMKDGVEILINTCFFWSVGEYAGLRIKYLVFD